jgi:hypothetical protein
MNQTLAWSLAVLWSALEVVQLAASTATSHHPSRRPTIPPRAPVGLQTEIDSLPGPMKASAPQPHAGQPDLDRAWRPYEIAPILAAVAGSFASVLTARPWITRAGEPALSARTLPERCSMSGSRLAVDCSGALFLPDHDRSGVARRRLPGVGAGRTSKVWRLSAD